MSLTHDDLLHIRSIVEDVIRPLDGEIKALRDDIKEIYGMISELQNKIVPDKEFGNLTVEQKLLKLNSDLLAAAKQAGISLPR